MALLANGPDATRNVPYQSVSCCLRARKLNGKKTSPSSTWRTRVAIFIGNAPSSYTALRQMYADLSSASMRNKRHESAMHYVMKQYLRSGNAWRFHDACSA